MPETRCWSVAPDAVTECEREHGHGGTHQRGGIYWETDPPCRCERPSVGPGIYPSCLDCGGRIGG